MKLEMDKNELFKFLFSPEGVLTIAYFVGGLFGSSIASGMKKYLEDNKKTTSQLSKGSRNFMHVFIIFSGTVMAVFGGKYFHEKTGLDASLSGFIIGLIGFFVAQYVVLLLLMINEEGVRVTFNIITKKITDIFGSK